MRFVISIVAALMVLGLAAFGVVSAQKMSATPSPATAVASAPQAAPAPVRRHPVNPVSQIAQTAGESAPAPAATPMRMAEATQATPPAPPAAPNPAPTRVAQASTPTPPAAQSAAPNAAAQPKPAPAATSIPPCDKPGGMGLARIVEIDTTGGPGFSFEHFKQYDFLPTGPGPGTRLP